MESNQLSEWKSSSSEETATDRSSDQSNVVDDMAGTGRSYECVFCKRGFTTAQALGGHMNIHRKDRAKTSRPPSIVSSSGKLKGDHDHDHDENNYGSSLRASSYFYPPPPPIQSYHQYHQPHYSSMPPEVHHVSYHQAAFFPTNWAFRPPHHGDDHQLFVHNNNSQPFDWPTSLSLQIGPSHLDHHDYQNKNKTDHGISSGDDQEEEEDEIDLELRLGHHP